MLPGGPPCNHKIGVMTGVIRGCVLLMAFTAWTEPALARSYDLGITGRNALVCGSSKGLGKGCAFALAREGVNLVITARGCEALEATAAEIRNATGVSVQIVACDITTPEGRDAALQVLPDPDILVTNAGGPPPGDYRDWRRESWISALDANMIAPIELIRLTIESMIDRKFGRCAAGPPAIRTITPLSSAEPGAVRCKSSRAIEGPRPAAK